MLIGIILYYKTTVANCKSAQNCQIEIYITGKYTFNSTATTFPKSGIILMIYTCNRSLLQNFYIFCSPQCYRTRKPFVPKWALQRSSLTLTSNNFNPISAEYEPSNLLIPFS